jgi:uncharacterized HAD superfamily protein
MYQYLDEGLASINMILGNRYVKVMRTEADTLKKNLQVLSEAFEQWYDVQKKWIYLETIFMGSGATSIKNSLPEESKMFESVNKYFTGLTLKVNKNPKALGLIKITPNIVE